ncbi:MAG: penicillin acylase family protein, partial [Anaerolineaceae bacterium]|nr:penicillin acylase family protein [Anaerolineaceae bacterium]
VKEGLSLLQLFPCNFMAADISGNIYYQRTGRVPERPEGYDFSKPVDGSTSKTEWLGIHSTADLLQVTNPPQGYMQNCNVPPDAMMENSPFHLENSLPYIFADLTQQQAFGYNTKDKWINSRGARISELLKADNQITAEKAMSIANDIIPFGANLWVEVLIQASKKYGSLHFNNPDYIAGINEIKSWNYELAANSKAALKYAYWRTQLMQDIGGDRLKKMSQRVVNLLEPLGEKSKPLSLNEGEQKQLVNSFARAMAKLRSDFGSIEKTYGEVFRVGRGSRSWPCEGGMSEFLGLTTVRCVQYGQEYRDHTRWAQSGQTSTGIVVLSKPIQSWTCVPFGQSNRPDSPHYYDQAEKLFSARKMKSTWWTPEELVNHIESRTLIDLKLPDIICPKNWL